MSWLPRFSTNEWIGRSVGFDPVDDIVGRSLIVTWGRWTLEVTIEREKRAR